MAMSTEKRFGHGFSRMNTDKAFCNGFLIRVHPYSSETENRSGKRAWIPACAGMTAT
jgi:hypothetical protein